MNKEAQEIFDQLLRKKIYELTSTDIVFLRARSDYLPLEQRKIYAEVLEDRKPAEKLSKTAKTPSPEQPAEPTTEDPKLSFKELKAIATEMGLKVPAVIKTEKLEAMIQEARAAQAES